MTLDDLKKNLGIIREVMDTKVGIDNPTGVAEKLEQLQGVAGLSAECIAWSRKRYDEKLKFLTMNKAYNNYTATEKKMIFGGEASEEIFLVNYAESLNKDYHYSVEAVRTLLSYLKEEMRAVK